MKKLIPILMIVLSFTVVLNTSAAETVPLQFAYSPVDYPNFFLLPNGYYEAVYYTPNTSDFWINQGRNDVSNCVVEVFDSFGQSIWSFPVLQVDILQDDANAFFYQNEVRFDQIVFEYYWNHSFERYVSKNWSFDGERLFTSFDSIQQAEESFRYIISQYPYTLEIWPFGETHDTPARLTYVADGSSVELPFAYGVRTTCVDADKRYYMLYEVNDISEGEPSVVYLLSYVPDTHELTYCRTNLPTCSGHLAVSYDTLVFLQEKVQENATAYALYTATFNSVEQDMISFTATEEISLAPNEVIENIIPAGNHLLYLKNRVVNQNTMIEHWDSELCALSSEGELASVQKWNGEALFLGNATGPLQFVCEDGTGGYQIIRLSDEDVAYFFTYFDHAQ